MNESVKAQEFALRQDIIDTACNCTNYIKLVLHSPRYLNTVPGALCRRILATRGHVSQERTGMVSSVLEKQRS